MRRLSELFRTEMFRNAFIILELVTMLAIILNVIINVFYLPKG